MRLYPHWICLRLRDCTCLFLTSYSLTRSGLNLGTSVFIVCQMQHVAILSVFFFFSPLWLTPTAVCNCSSPGTVRVDGLAEASVRAQR